MLSAQETLDRCREVLREHYGQRLDRIVLYGSAARGDDTPESDLDLLVVLNGPVDLLAELSALVDLLYPIQLESDRYISAKPAPADEFEAGKLRLYRNARREGVPI